MNSEMTPTTATLLAELCHEIGLPRGVLNVVHGVGPRCGQAMLEHPDIDAISFTGGTATGAIVGSVAGRTFKKMSLELGGKNPNVIFADCDLDRAIETSVRSSFANSGQICLCGSRILVERSIYDEFLRRFVETAQKMIVVGPPGDSSMTMGPVVSFAHREKIEKMIAVAKEQGGKILLGGGRPTAEWATKGAYLNVSRVVGTPVFSVITAVHHRFLVFHSQPSLPISVSRASRSKKKFLDLSSLLMLLTTRRMH
jgi:aminomuconate-semialdehyde/2-hydroxymuconate-6-semialdehyde dehydrogenase